VDETQPATDLGVAAMGEDRQVPAAVAGLDPPRLTVQQLKTRDMLDMMVENLTIYRKADDGTTPPQWEMPDVYISVDGYLSRPDAPLNHHPIGDGS
jgi:hypothetical protein